MLFEELKSFCNETSIHGLSQIANDRAHVLKRLFWALIFVGSLAYAGQQLSSSIRGTKEKNLNISPHDQVKAKA